MGRTLRVCDDPDATSRCPRVELDVEPERCGTVAGARLWRGIAQRAAVGAIALGVVAGLLTGAHWSSGVAVAAGLVAAAVWAGGFAVVTSLRLAQDLRTKEHLAVRYGCLIRFGSDAVQQRRFRIVEPPANLAAIVLAALRELSPSVVARRVSDACFEAVRPRRALWDLGLRIEVCLDEKTDGSVAAAASCRPCGYWMPFATDPAVYADGGRAIENIEEFQLALRRLVERTRRH